MERKRPEQHQQYPEQKQYLPETGQQYPEDDDLEDYISYKPEIEDFVFVNPIPVPGVPRNPDDFREWFQHMQGSDQSPIPNKPSEASSNNRTNPL